MFKGVFLDGKIINPVSGKEIYLRLIGDKPSIPYVQSASIGLKLGENMEMSISLVPNYETALELLSKDSEWFRLGNTLGLRWGYTDVSWMISDWYYGFMQVPSVSYGEEITIDIPATTMNANSRKIESVHVWSTAEKPLSFYKIAQIIAQKYGLKLVLGTLRKETEKLINMDRPNWIQGGRTDLCFLMTEGETLGIRVIQKNDQMIFVDKTAPMMWEPAVNATFQMYGKIDLENNIFPLLSFNPESMGTMFIQDHQGLMTYMHGPNSDPEKDAEPIISTTSDSDVEPGYTAQTTYNAPTEEGPSPNVKGSDGQTITAKTTVKVDSKSGEAGRIYSLPLDGDETEEFVKSIISSVRENSADEQGLKINWSAIGLPNLIPGMYAGIIGTGDFFDGTYCLYEATYNISSGGAEMNCVGQGRGFPVADDNMDAFLAKYEAFKEIPKGDLSVVLSKGLPAEK